MKIDKPNQGYVFRGTTWELLKEFFALGDEGEIVCTGSRFTPLLHSAIGYSHLHTKTSKSVPCVICIDAKYTLEDPIIVDLCLAPGYSQKINGTTYPEIGTVPLSEIKIFKTDRISGIEHLVKLAESNPNKELKEIVESYGGWEIYKSKLVEDLKIRKEKCH